MGFVSGCDRQPPSRPTNRLAQSRRAGSTVLLKTIAAALNDLPRSVVTELLPPQPILDDSKSADGQPVLATCKVNPQDPDGPFNYLEVPKGNANFRRLRVRPGDLVRYFINYDPESLKHGIKQVKYVELTVRRLDINNPQNALIIEGGLSGPVTVPQRIEIWRFSDKRMNEIRLRLTRYLKQRKPPVAWEPSPDEGALVQIVDRLNQWLRNSSADDNAWQPEPLLQQLPEKLRQSKTLSPMISSESLRDGPFQPWDGRLLQQAIWLRDIAAWAKTNALSDVDTAAALFDWTVRNIQLDDSDDSPIVHHPWQALMYGHGTAEQRAWVFAELCRQQQLDVVMLAIQVAQEKPPRWWLPALFSEGHLYLFDTRLGLPLPGQEQGSVATLAEVVTDPKLLRKLDLDAEHAYPVTAEDLAHVEAWLAASPLQLSLRATRLERVLEGEDFVVLAVDNRPLVEGLSNHPHIADVRLWPLPFQAILDERSMKSAARLRAVRRFVVFAQRPTLWKARVLHFQGTKPVPFEERNDPLAQPRYGHREALQLYQSRRVRPSEAILKRLEPAKQAVYRRAKGDASYWLGLLCYDLGKYEVAVHWLGQRTLEASPDGPWTPGARYNLARVYEALGKLPKAVQLLTADTSPQRHGNHLRARQLKQKISAE